MTGVTKRNSRTPSRRSCARSAPPWGPPAAGAVNARARRRIGRSPQCAASEARGWRERSHDDTSSEPFPGFAFPTGAAVRDGAGMESLDDIDDGDEFLDGDTNSESQAGSGSGCESGGVSGGGGGYGLYDAQAESLNGEPRRALG